MIITLVQLRQIIASGGGVVIDGSSYTLSQLKQIAKEAGTTNATITIKGISNLTPQQLKQIASLAPGLIIFDLT